MAGDTNLSALFQTSLETFSNQTAVIFDDKKTHAKLTYFELGELKDEVIDVLRSHSNLIMSKNSVGVICSAAEHLPALILGVLDSASSFVYLDEESPASNLQYLIKEAGISMILCDTSAEQDLLSKLVDLPLTRVNSVNICGHLVSMLHVSLACDSSGSRSTKDLDRKEANLAFTITTSGTTGFPKIVHVPHDCIVPNVLDLRSRLHVTVDDLIFMASPMTFDPSIVEMFVAFSSGATLLITDKIVKQSPTALIDMLTVRHKVSILQATPTLLYQCGPFMLQSSLLSRDTALRVLLLGGEPCPSTGTINSWKQNENETDIYNIYGVTEVSSWATIYKILESDLRADGAVPLGSPMLDTAVEVRDTFGVSITEGIGQLFVGSDKRKCLIDDEAASTSQSMRATGDWVKIKDGNMYFHGRKDTQVKRHGKRLNLMSLEKVAMRYENVTSCCAVFRNGCEASLCMYITLSSGVAESDNLKQYMKVSLKSYEQPDEMIVIKTLPMTSHGKVDRAKLASLPTKLGNVCKTKSFDRRKFITNTWCDCCNIKDVADDQSFSGDSFAAVKFVQCIENYFDKDFSELYKSLLTSAFTSISDYIISSVDDQEAFSQDAGLTELPSGSEQCNSSADSEIISDAVAVPEKFSHTNNLPKSKKLKLAHLTDGNVETFCTSWQRTGREILHGTACVSSPSKSMSDALITEPNVKNLLETKIDICVRWCYNLGKCIDASPLVAFNGYYHVVFIGSHSHRMSAISLSTGDKLWEVLLPDRIESSACLSSCGKYVIVGCYDYCIYIICAKTGEIVWKLETGGEVKSSPCSDSASSLIFCGSHDNYIYAFSVEEKMCSWRQYLGGGGIFSSPVVSQHPHLLFSATLRGKLHALEPLSGKIIWTFDSRKPIFSSPAVLKNGICFGCVNRFIYKLSFKGILMQKFMVGGPVFSSPCCYRQWSNGSAFIVIGCHDNHVYCLTADTFDVKWKTELDSPVYSSPYYSKFLELNRSFLPRYGGCVTVTSTSGMLYLLSANTGEKLACYKFPFEAFSSPVVVGKQVIVGCRDDYVYCLDVR